MKNETLSIVDEIKGKVEQFAKTHADETFYAFSIDSSLLCLNSEEQFQKTLQNYIENWEKENSALYTKESMPEEELEHHQELYNSYKEAGISSFKNLFFEEYLDQQIEIENQVRADNKSKGNPYLQPDKIHSLRLNTGDWHYQGFAEIKYALDQKAKSNLLQTLDQNRKVIFSSLKMTEDFKIFLAGHVY